MNHTPPLVRGSSFITGAPLGENSWRMPKTIKPNAPRLFRSTRITSCQNSLQPFIQAETPATDQAFLPRECPIFPSDNQASKMGTKTARSRFRGRLKKRETNDA